MYMCVSFLSWTFVVWMCEKFMDACDYAGSVNFSFMIRLPEKIQIWSKTPCRVFGSHMHPCKCYFTVFECLCFYWFWGLKSNHFSKVRLFNLAYRLLQTMFIQIYLLAINFLQKKAQITLWCFNNQNVDIIFILIDLFMNKLNCVSCLFLSLTVPFASNSNSRNSGYSELHNAVSKKMAFDFRHTSFSL